MKRTKAALKEKVRCARRPSLEPRLMGTGGRSTSLSSVSWAATIPAQSESNEWEEPEEGYVILLTSTGIQLGARHALAESQLPHSPYLNNLFFFFFVQTICKHLTKQQMSNSQSELVKNKLRQDNIKSFVTE